MRISCTPEWPSTTPTNLVGACEAQGHPLRVFVERPDPEAGDPAPEPRAWLTVRFEGVEAGFPPPAALAGVTEIDLAGTVWPVLPRVLKCKNSVLQGSIPAAAADGLFGQALALQAQAQAQAPEQAAAGPADGGDPGPETPQRDVGPVAVKPNPLIVKLKDIERIEADAQAATAEVTRLTRRARNLSEELEDAQEDLRAAKSRLAALRAEMADVGSQIREILDAEGI